MTPKASEKCLLHNTRHRPKFWSNSRKFVEVPFLIEAPEQFSELHDEPLWIMVHLPHDNLAIPCCNNVQSQYQDASAHLTQHDDRLAAWQNLQCRDAQLWEANVQDWEQIASLAAAGHESRCYQTAEGSALWRTAQGVPEPGQSLPLACNDWQVFAA